MIFFADLSGPGPGSTTAATGKVIGPGAYDVSADLSDYESFVVESVLPGGAGGTMQVGLQRSLDGGVTWSDWLRFADALTGDPTGVSAKRYSVSPSLSNTPVQVGYANNAFGLAAASCAGGPPGDRLRVLYVPQSGVNAIVTYSILLFAVRKTMR